MKVLMVCLGNICRSPMAEGIFREEAIQKGIELHVDSCGTANYHVGDEPDSRSTKKSKQHGIDISHLRGRQFSKNDFKSFDIILTMDSENYDNIKALAGNKEEISKVKMVLNYSFPESNASVPDPYYGGDQGFEDVYQMLEKASNNFFKKHFNG